jgi:hypothetical protein
VGSAERAANEGRRGRPLDDVAEEVLGELDVAAEEIGLIRRGGVPPQRELGGDGKPGALEAAGAVVRAPDRCGEKAPGLVPESGDGPPAASCRDLAELPHEVGEARAELETGRAGAKDLGGEPAEEQSGALSPGQAYAGGSHHRETEVSVGLFEGGDVLARVLVGHGGLDQESRGVAEGAGIASLLLLDGESLAGDSLKVCPWHTRSFRGSRQLEVRLAIASGPDPNPHLRLAACPFGSNSGRRGVQPVNMPERRNASLPAGPLTPG